MKFGIVLFVRLAVCSVAAAQRAGSRGMLQQQLSAVNPLMLVDPSGPPKTEPGADNATNNEPVQVGSECNLFFAESSAVMHVHA
jgi:hypothetical protein